MVGAYITRLIYQCVYLEVNLGDIYGRILVVRSHVTGTLYSPPVTLVLPPGGAPIVQGLPAR